MVFECQMKKGDGEWNTVVRDNADGTESLYTIKIDHEDMRRFIHMFSKLYVDDVSIAFRVIRTVLPDHAANYEFSEGGLRRYGT